MITYLQSSVNLLVGLAAGRAVLAAVVLPLITANVLGRRVADPDITTEALRVAISHLSYVLNALRAERLTVLQSGHVSHCLVPVLRRL